MKTRLIKSIALGLLLGVTNFAHAGTPPPPTASWSPVLIDFGNLEVGTSSTATPTLDLFCYEPPSCNYILELDSLGSLDFFPNPTSGTVPGDSTLTSLDIDVMFAPTSLGPQIDFLTATVTDAAGNEDQATLELRGVGIAPIPIPAAFWLFGSGLLGLVGIARRKKAA